MKLFLLTILYLIYCLPCLAQTGKVVAGALKDDSVYTKVDKPPGFPGGKEFFLQFIANNIKYRDEDVDDPLQRQVMVQFIVEPDGSLSNIKAIRGPSKAMMAEAVRVLSLSPKWHPGNWEGNKLVRVWCTVPVAFVLE